MIENMDRDGIKIYFCDFWQPFDTHKNIYISILEKDYKVTVTPDDPDFLFHSCFGQEHLKYSCVKICCLGENLSPDFNISDYAYGFDHMEFEDRYIRYPLYKLHLKSEDLTKKEHAFFSHEAKSKKKFCNFIYSNNRNSAPEREFFFHMLSQYKKVDSGGALLNNIGHRVSDKRAWQRQFKFSIAFENSCKNGYTTEKILDALQAHTIPIYWGNPRVAEDFNPERFINCHDYHSFENVLSIVKKLDNNPESYTAILEKPWFTSHPTHLPHEDPVFVDFFRHIIEQGPEKARRTTRYGYTSKYYLYQQISKAAAEPVLKLRLRFQGLLRRIRGLC